MRSVILRNTFIRKRSYSYFRAFSNLTTASQKNYFSTSGNDTTITKDKRRNTSLSFESSIQKPAGKLFDDDTFIPQTSLYPGDGRSKKRVLVLCTGGTLSMAPDKSQNGALAPVKGFVSSYMESMRELKGDHMPDVVVHEYDPLLDSSDLGPDEWAVLATDIKTNYHHFDGFVVLMGTDTMAYASTAVSFLLENLGSSFLLNI